METYRKTLDLAPVLVALTLLSTFVLAQDKTVPLPKEAMAILVEGNNRNGLGTATKPWHIKVDFHLFDDDGDEIRSGTYEEFWISSTKNKRVYESDSLHQTDITTDSGVFQSGEAKLPNWEELRARDEFIDPVAIHDRLDDFKLEKAGTSIGKVRMECVSLIAKNRPVVRIIGYDEKTAAPHYCFSPDQPMLRFKSDGAATNEVIYNDIVSFNSVYVARDVQINMRGKPRLKMHLLALDSDPALAADYSVPVEAKNMGHRFAVDPAAMGRRAINEPFPTVSQTKGVVGKVSVRIAVGTDGHVLSATALDGPDALRQPVVDAVLRWIYKPYLQDGNPVEVETQFSVEIRN